tara:strand:- start:1965 stop:2396 length:432 start_codon:yes stop_codon:yes gene_type:complete
VTITESISLNSQEKGSTNTLTIASVHEVSQRIITTTTTERIILAFDANILAGQFVESTVKYIRITNKDATNHCTLVFRSGTAECAHKLDAGHSFIYAGDNSGGVVATHDAEDTALTVSLATLDDITALADTADVDLELFIAGT